MTALAYKLQPVAHAMLQCMLLYILMRKLAPQVSMITISQIKIVISNMMIRMSNN